MIESYNAGSQSIGELFEELLKLSRNLNQEQERHVRENMTEEELVIFDILTRPAPELSADERAEVKKVARELLNKMKLLLVLNWRQKSTARSQLKLTIEDVLDTGLPRTYTPELYRQKCSALFEHVYESYMPPPPADVSGLMFELLTWWNKEAAKLSPVLSSAIVHYRFETIHPFADGNGRTGRALALWELYRRGFDTHHIFSVDEFYWENRPRYYEALDRARREGEDLTKWLEYCAEGLLLTLERVWTRVQKLSAQPGQEKLVLRPKQEQLLQLLRDHKSMTPRELWDALGVSKQGTLDLLRPLIKAGLVKRVGTKKAGQYILA